MTVCLPDGSLSFLICQLSFDICIAKILPQKREVKFSGQYFPLIHVREGRFLKREG